MTVPTSGSLPMTTRGLNVSPRVAVHLRLAAIGLPVWPAVLDRPRVDAEVDGDQIKHHQAADN
jgi:hypothetical protein